MFSGNRFLADLCDADVLVHVVDATGRSDRDGNALGGGEIGAFSSKIQSSTLLGVLVFFRFFPMFFLLIFSAIVMCSFAMQGLPLLKTLSG